jgi:hypothetical protein
VGGANPKSWALEVSHDKEAWTEIDDRKGNSDLNGANITKTYQTHESEFYRYVRLILTGPNHQGNNYLLLSGFELFGDLQRNEA